MKVAVLGGGFGIYGYLPALASLGCTVLLPQRYRPAVEGRGELVGTLAAIHWCPDEACVLDQAHGAVIARRPGDQVALMPGILARPRIGFLILEKPLAGTPADAARLHADLAASDKAFRLGYTFLLTDWGRRMIAAADAGHRDTVAITWRFRAHHYATNAPTWKRRHSEGGGALRFYGIQVIALLARLGYDDVLSSTADLAAEDDVETWEAVFSGGDAARCRVRIESNADQRDFRIQSAALGTTVDLDDPFAGGPQVARDRRVPLLEALCRDALAGSPQLYAWYEPALALWRRTEQMTMPRRA